MASSTVLFLVMGALFSTPGRAQSSSISIPSSIPTPTPTATVLPSPTPLAGWTYYGCVNEVPELGRTLSGASISGNMTIEKCTSFCSAPEQGFPFAGLEYADQCFCGSNASNNGATAGQTGCDMPCSSDATQICGGPHRLSVYANAAFSPPAIVASIAVDNPAGVYLSQGCFTERTTGRALGEHTFVNRTMTPTLCVNRCHARGFSYAGVEYSTECFCGNVLAPNSVAAPPAECNMKCGGNPKTICGGLSRLVVYLKSPAP